MDSAYYGYYGLYVTGSRFFWHSTTLHRTFYEDSDTSYLNFLHLNLKGVSAQGDFKPEYDYII